MTDRRSGPTTASDGRAVHDDAVRVLASWRAPDDEQERLRRAFVEHLRAHPDGARRDGPPTHLTASTLVVDADRTHTVLVLHRKASAWFQPGGHVEDGDAALAAAAAREAREETGIADLRVDSRPVHLDRHLLGGGFGRCHEHLDVRYLAVAPSSSRPSLSAESLDVRWWPIDDLPDSAISAGVADLVRAAIRG